MPTDNDEIAAAIRTRHVLTPIHQVVLYDSEDPATDVLPHLSTAGFDFAPVCFAGEISGYVRQRDLADSKASLACHVRPLTATCLVSGDAPLGVLLQALQKHPFLFVIDGESITGIATPSDLNKQPGRAYFYLLIADLELTLAARLREEFEDQQDALALLSDGRRVNIMRRLSDEQNADVLADVIAAMDLTDLLNIARNSDDLRHRCGDYTRKQWKELVCQPITQLRHNVMHTVRTLATDRPQSLHGLIEVDRRLRHLVAAIDS